MGQNDPEISEHLWLAGGQKFRQEGLEWLLDPNNRDTLFTMFGEMAECDDKESQAEMMRDYTDAALVILADLAAVGLVSLLDELKARTPDGASN